MTSTKTHEYRNITAKEIELLADRMFNAAIAEPSPLDPTLRKDLMTAVAFIRKQVHDVPGTGTQMWVWKTP